MKVEGKRGLSGDDIADFFEGKIDRALAVHLDICGHCGLCGQHCHIYRAEGEAKASPPAKTERVRRLYWRFTNPFRRWLARRQGRYFLTEEEIEDLKESSFQCTLCQRCTLYCPFGLDNTLLVGLGRSLVTEMGRTPEGIKEAARNALEVGNSMAISPEQYRERIEWLQDELRDELGDDTISIPMDKVGADIFLVVTAVQVMKFPQIITSAAKIFHAAGASWTLSSHRFDSSNFGLFAADSALSRELTRSLVAEGERLSCKTMVVSECGHAFFVLHRRAAQWLGRELPFEVKSIVEVMAEYIKEGQIILDPSRNPQPVTYHDPCNLARKGGIIEEPRYILSKAVMDFREMNPNREYTWCCGGGGGLIAVEEWDRLRRESGKPKAEQIKATEATVVATACDNCKLQLMDLNQEYGLGVRVTGITDLVANALVWKPRPERAEEVKEAVA